MDKDRGSKAVKVWQKTEALMSIRREGASREEYLKRQHHHHHTHGHSLPS